MPVYSITEHGEQTATVDTRNGVFTFEYTGDNSFVEDVLRGVADYTELVGKESEGEMIGTIEIEVETPTEQKVRYLEGVVKALPGVAMEQTTDRRRR